MSILTPNKVVRTLLKVFPNSGKTVLPEGPMKNWNLTPIAEAVIIGPHLLVADVDQGVVIVQHRIEAYGGDVAIWRSNDPRPTLCETEYLEEELDLIGWVSCLRDTLVSTAINILASEVDPADPMPMQKGVNLRPSILTLNGCGLDWDEVKGLIAQALPLPWEENATKVAFRVKGSAPGVVGGRLVEDQGPIAPLGTYSLEYRAFIPLDGAKPIDMKGKKPCQNLSEAKEYLALEYVSLVLPKVLNYHLKHGLQPGDIMIMGKGKGLVP
jgi:hypothetical protein